MTNCYSGNETPALSPAPANIRVGEIVDLSALAEMGKVAGVAGIAVGMIALLAPQIIKGASSLPRAERSPLLRLVTIGAFAIGALGIIAWLIAGMQGTTVKTGDCGLANTGTVTGSPVTCGPSAPPASKP